MATPRRSSQLSLRISVEELGRIREAASAAGETVARFVREAASQRCAALDRERRGAAAPGAESSDRLARSQRLVLAAVTTHAGLGSVTAVAEAAGLSWSAARKAVDSLAERGVIRQRAWKQSWRDGVRDRRAWEPALSSPDFERLWAQARHVSLPAPPPPREYAGPLPPQFWTLFWNHPDPSSLLLPADADYISNRLLNGPSALAALWASVHLPADALRSSLALRSTRPHTRSLIENALAHRSTVPA